MCVVYASRWCWSCGRQNDRQASTCTRYSRAAFAIANSTATGQPAASSTIIALPSSCDSAIPTTSSRINHQSTTIFFVNNWLTLFVVSVCFVVLCGGCVLLLKYRCKWIASLRCPIGSRIAARSDCVVAWWCSCVDRFQTYGIGSGWIEEEIRRRTGACVARHQRQPSLRSAAHLRLQLSRQYWLQNRCDLHCSVSRGCQNCISLLLFAKYFKSLNNFRCCLLFVFVFVEFAGVWCASVPDRFRTDASPDSISMRSGGTAATAFRGLAYGIRNRTDSRILSFCFCFCWFAIRSKNN